MIAADLRRARELRISFPGSIHYEFAGGIQTTAEIVA